MSEFMLLKKVDKSDCRLDLNEACAIISTVMTSAAEFSATDRRALFDHVASEMSVLFRGDLASELSEETDFTQDG